MRGDAVFARTLSGNHCTLCAALGAV